MPNSSVAALADMPSSWRGSEKTAQLVRSEIAERFGSEAASLYDPSLNARTFRGWLKVGYRVKAGEKSLRSMTMVEKKDSQGNIVRKYPKQVCLFFQTQVEPITNP
ncbi:MAG: hypothetical protein WCW31_00420 [Patescibacteria group bacterium]